MTSKHDLLNKASEMLKHLTDGVYALGHLIHDACSEHPDFLTELHKRCPLVSKTLLRRLQRVGEGSLIPEVALGMEHGFLLERLSIADQRKVLIDGVPAAVGDGGADTIVLRASQMDTMTAGRVMKNGVLRPVDEQRADILAQEDHSRRVAKSLESAARSDVAKRASQKSALKRLPLVFKKNSVTVTRPVTLTLAHLTLIIAEIENHE